MTNHVFHWYAEFRGYGRLRSLGILGGRPSRELSIFELGERHHRLHWSVRQQRNVVVGLDNMISGGKLLVRVAYAADELSWLVRRFPKLFFVFNGVVGFV